MVYDEVGAWSGRVHPQGAFEGLMLGSVSHAVIHGAGCAVAVVGEGPRVARGDGSSYADPKAVTSPAAVFERVV